ncbi:MAG: hypothetical protein FK734_05580 [Asgard group archaeon]|nr:hypothetical protein [Asgard group archaeon]
MSSNNDFKILLLIGTLIGFIGAALLALGMFLEFNIFDTGTVNVFGLAIITLVVGIFIICLLTFIGGITKHGFSVNDERPGLVALAIFLFTPTILISTYTTPMFYLLDLGNSMLGSAQFGFYLAFIGLALILIAFFIHLWIYLWKNRGAASGGLNLGGSSDTGFVKLIRIITSILFIIAGVGVILGLVIPIYTDSIIPNIGSLLMSESSNQFDLNAMGFLVLVAGLVITAIFTLLSNFGVSKISKSELPVLIFTLIAFILPGYVPSSTMLVVFWSIPIYELLALDSAVMESSTATITTFGWIFMISLLVVILAFVLGVLSYFFSKSATFSARPGRREKVSTSSLEAKRKKGKFPTGPPSISGPPSGTLAAQLSGPPAALSGPPSASGAQPTISSSPPTPPSFMPTTSTPSSSSQDTPTCPFCGKALRYIDEYARWYCDSCAQYV